MDYAMRGNSQLIWALLAAGILSVAFSSADAKEFSVKGASPEQEYIFIAGVLSGIRTANVSLMLEGKPMLFCDGLDTVVNVDTAIELLDRVLVGPHDAEIVSIAILRELQNKYPCQD